MRIVSEIGLSHDGSLGNAMAMIDACAEAGAWACKFQNRLGDRCTQFRRGTSFPQDYTRSDYWRRTAFDPHHWEALSERARNRGLKFGCSVSSVQGLEIMAPLCDFIKIGSGNIDDGELLKATAATGKPVMLSWGMDDEKAAIEAMSRFMRYGQATLLWCISKYPPSAEETGSLFRLPKLLQPFGTWGLSDHSGTIWPGIIAAWEGADVLEVHVTWHSGCFGPDTSSSLTFEQLKELLGAAAFVERMKKPVDRKELMASLEETRRVFRGK